MTKPKMIVKGVSFNPNSKRHMELLDWLNEQQDNFSAFARELIAIEYEKSKLGVSNNQIEIVVEENKDLDMSMI